MYVIGHHWWTKVQKKLDAWQGGTMSIVTPQVLSLHVALALHEHKHHSFIHEHEHVVMHLLVYA